MKHDVRYTAHKRTRLSLWDQLHSIKVTFYYVSTTVKILTAVFWVRVHGSVKIVVVTISMSASRYRTTRRHEPEHETLLFQTRQLAADQNLKLEARLHTTAGNASHHVPRRNAHITNTCCYFDSSRHFATHSIHRTNTCPSNASPSAWRWSSKTLNTYGGCF